ncbi:MAG: hypothetical protein LBJ69_01855 [Holosporales bacterium]|jgi:hypothetical protein|nr:hypothetical protein [Holosporales bacterium]
MIRRIQQIDFSTITQYVRRNIFALCAVAVAVFVNIMVHTRMVEITMEFTETNSTLSAVQDLIQDPQKLDFITTHSFSGERQNFEEFAHKICDDNLAKNAAIQVLEETKVGLLSMQKIDITCLFWHEKLVFEFLEALQKFKPGFVRISLIDITNFAEVSARSPALKVQVVCELYQR